MRDAWLGDGEVLRRKYLLTLGDGVGSSLGTGRVLSLKIPRGFVGGWGLLGNWEWSLNLVALVSVPHPMLDIIMREDRIGPESVSGGPAEPQARVLLVIRPHRRLPSLTDIR